MLQNFKFIGLDKVKIPFAKIEEIERQKNQEKEEFYKDFGEQY